MCWRDPPSFCIFCCLYDGISDRSEVLDRRDAVFVDSRGKVKSTTDVLYMHVLKVDQLDPISIPWARGQLDVGDKTNSDDWCKVTKKKLGVNLTKATQNRAKELAAAKKKSKQDPDKWKHPCFFWVNRKKCWEDFATIIANFNSSLRKATVPCH